ncbi:MAG: hypothetical protein LH645_10590 [Actinomycetia bacterium]|nr:hypothetical protein [Actinomycetes bacterium]
MNDTMVLSNGTSSDEYQRRVASALAFLSAEDREEILAGVGEHLREVSVEGVDLVERLGTPEAYARELTTAAGLGQDGSSRRGLMPHNAWRRLNDHRWTRSVATFLPTLRPAWWVLRGYLAVVVLTMVFVSWPTILWLVPTTGQGPGELLAGILLLCLAIPLSISIGRRTLSTSARRAVVVVNTVLLVVSGYALVNVGAVVDNALHAYPNSGYIPTSGLRHNGDPIRNITVFDAEGNPLTDVRLFDQNGEPITVQSGVQLRFIQRSVDEFGVESRNTYPLVVVDRDGEPIPGKLISPVTTIPALKQPAATQDDQKAQASDKKKATEQKR